MAPQDKQDWTSTAIKIDFVKNPSPAQQEMLRTNPIQNFIPWRAVWNGNSVSTLRHLVFDVSRATSSDASLNDLLAKGKNNIKIE